MRVKVRVWRKEESWAPHVQDDRLLPAIHMMVQQVVPGLRRALERPGALRCTVIYFHLQDLRLGISSR